MAIDITFDFRTDANGKDPDSHSPTLRRYHQFLWSKSLPGGALFDLSDTRARTYLYHRSNLGEFFLSSDTVMPTFANWKRLRSITSQLSDQEVDAFDTIVYTVGGMMVFPSNQIDRKPTINAARGFNPRISDRFDLTVECIRRHYANQDSPLGATISRYANFFALFDDFRGYVSFFLLEDLVNDNLDVRFFMPFDDFHSPAVPQDVNTYMDYRRLSIEFIEARNQRIKRLGIGLPPALTLSEEVPSESSDLAWLRDFVSRRRWQRGKADPSHEYTVREWMAEREEDFERAVGIVRSFGKPAQFWSNTYIYLYQDGFKYWTMGDPISETTVINRESDDDPSFEA